MFQKTMIFRSAMISLVVCLLISCSFGVVASAADYSKIDISDYVSGREFVGDDVIVSYELPLNPWTEIYAFETGSNIPLMIDSFDGNFLFSQGAIDETWNVFDIIDSWFLYEPASGSTRVQVQQYFDDMLAVSHILVNGTIYPVDIVYSDYEVEINYEVDGLDMYFDYFYGTGHDSYISFQWSGFDIEGEFAIGVNEVFTDTADYQRINGNMFPLGKTNGATNMIDVRDIRSGYGFTLSFDLSFTIDHDSETDLDGNTGNFDAVWLDKNYEEVDRSQFEIDLIPYRDHANLQYDIDFTVPEGAAYFYLRLNTGYFYVNTAYEFSWVFRNISMTATLSSIEENSQTMGKVVYKLDQLDGKLDGVIDGLGDVKDVLQDTNDKLDDMQGTLEDLPGNIGDEFENVIDQENEKHESAGQEFVDQILDILPDSSTEIMAALRSLPDAMSYTGTEAVLQIPGIVMPAVGDLIPRTEIWSGAELDFSDYVELLPPTLLNLVRALFTIAIVLFCAYELKGIVSYCLTLKDNGRGA